MEQAAGFPPFTRGYHEYKFVPNIIPNTKTIITDFELSSIQPDAIFELFQDLENQITLKSTFYLHLNVACNFQLIIFTRVLRTLLSIFSIHKKNNSKIAKFHFIIKNEDTKNILTNHQYLQMSQVDTLLTNSECLFILNNTPKMHLPVDALYGSYELDRETKTIFSNVWGKISSHFNL